MPKLASSGGKGPSPSEFDLRLPHARVHVYAANTVVFAQGNAPDAVYFIDQGLVKLTHTHASGRLAMLDLRTRGSFMGLASAIANRPHAVTAEALVRCTCRVLSAADFRVLLREDKALSWYVHQLQSRRLYDSLARFVRLSSFSARRRLECLLAELIASHPPGCGGGEARIPATLKHWEMAAAIGVNAPYFSRLIGGLEKEGVIRRHKGWLFIPHPEKLTPACED